MKINIGKIVKILSQLIVAAPAIIAAVKPIIREVKGAPRKPTTDGPNPAQAPTGETITLAVPQA